MNELDLNRLNNLTERIIGCAIEVHRHLGPGLLESIYEKALCHEFDSQQIAYTHQMPVPILYKEQLLGDYRVDFIVEDTILLELKAVDKLAPVFEAQILSYLKMTDKILGLLVNFNVPRLHQGLKRVIMSKNNLL